MILVDAYLLLYAEDSLSEHHESARTLWDAQLSGSAPVCLCRPVLTAFIRIATNARLHQRPLTFGEAVGFEMSHKRLHSCSRGISVAPG